MLRTILIAGLLGWCASPDRPSDDPVQITVDPASVVNRVDEKIYGHFLEHIYHSVNGGLWGELVWDRSFEGGAGGISWKPEGNTLVQEGSAPDVRLTFGDPKWTDYEFTLEARKTGGEEGFLILLRALDKKQFYWANLGGWGNKGHALERGTRGEDRHRGVTKLHPGSIETGRWYRIRARCEGLRIRIWLDDTPVLDYTDDGKGPAAGRAGVGTWQTQAQFRNLKVASLNGTVLHEGLPPVPGGGREGIAPAWKSFGDGRVSTSTENPLNSQRCKLIESEGGETGLLQEPLCVRAGETYRGSLWARGHAPAGLVVRLTDGEKTLARQTLPAPGETWTELPIGLKPPEGSDHAALRVSVMGKARVWLDQVSLMPESWRQAGGFRPDLLKAVADLRPPVIRWPGGCYASFYRWKDGVGPQHKRVRYPNAMWDDVDVNSYGTDEFVAMCRRIGAEPLIVVNIGMHKPREERDAYCREACEWIEYCNGPATSPWGRVRAENGHPEPYGVKYWEIDNEVWKLTPEDYVSVVRQFAPAMKKADPSITLLACGSGQLGGHWAAGDEKVIDEAADLVDYLSIHHYENPARYADGPARAEAFYRKLADRIARSKNPRLRLYKSEWNAQSTDWRTGLYAGGILNAFERNGDVVGLAGPALFLRHVSARAWDNALINFDHRTWFPAPNYVVMKLWRDHYAPLRVGLSGDAGPVNAVATKTEDGSRLVLKAVNPSDRPVAMKVTVGGDFSPKEASLTLVAPGSLEARNTLDRPDAVRPAPGQASVDGRTVSFTLPPLSAGVLSIGRR